MISDITWKKKLQPTNILLKLQKWGTRNRNKLTHTGKSLNH